MEDDLEFFKIGRRPLSFWKMEDDLNPRQIKDEIKNFKNGRQPEF